MFMLLSCCILEFNGAKGGNMLAILLSSSEQLFLHTIALMKRARVGWERWRGRRHPLCFRGLLTFPFLLFASQHRWTSILMRRRCLISKQLRFECSLPTWWIAVSFTQTAGVWPMRNGDLLEKTINIVIVAHVDAGKTSLTERILYETHVIDEIGRVDKGTTQTDSLELEKRRGITIKASVVSFLVNDVKINLIDTPGHADFIAEVERSFSVLDGAILVLSAVEGVQAQTKILMTVLMKLGIPTIIFVNKIDRSGAQSDALIERIKEKLTEHVIPLYRAENMGTKQAFIVENSFTGNMDQPLLEASIELIALHDEAVLAAYVNEEEVTPEQVKRSLIDQIRSAKMYPVFFGSAMTGVGVSELLAGITALFPVHTVPADAPLSGVVFKIEKDAAGEKIAYVRVFAGSLNVREPVAGHRKRQDGEMETRIEKVKKLHLFSEGKTVQVQTVETGEFCKVWGLKEVKIGDVVGDGSDNIKSIHFAEPQMETRIEVQQKEKKHELYQALKEM